MMDRGQCVAQMGTAVLVRNNTPWRILVNGTAWRRLPIDDLFMGDRLQFPSGTTGRALLKVVLTYGRMFRDGRSEIQTEPLKASYEVKVDVDCPSCGDSGAHSIEITPQEVNHCTTNWPLTRRCMTCEAEWVQQGRRPELFHDEVLAAIRS